MMDDPKKPRGSNWAENEKVVLITNVLKHENVLFGKLKGPGGLGFGVSVKTKAQTWLEVSNAVNA